jgi:hypothetical protein
MASSLRVAEPRSLVPKRGVGATARTTARCFGSGWCKGWSREPSRAVPLAAKAKRAHLARESSTRFDSSFADLEIEASRFVPTEGPELGTAHGSRARRTLGRTRSAEDECRPGRANQTRPAHRAHLSRGIDSRSGTRARSRAADLGRSRRRPTGKEHTTAHAVGWRATERALAPHPRTSVSEVLRKKRRALVLHGGERHRAGR